MDPGITDEIISHVSLDVNHPVLTDDFSFNKKGTFIQDSFLKKRHSNDDPPVPRRSIRHLHPDPDPTRGVR